MVLSVAFWAFARSFLQKEGWMPVGWLVGLAVLILMAVLDWGLISLPFDVRWFASEGVPFLLSAAAWACFSAQAALITWYEYHRNKSPLHRNRIKYLVASIVLVVAGYGFHLTQLESYQYLGLGTHWLGAVIAIYAVVSEHLPDISAHIRQALNYLVIALFTIAVYLLSIYVAQAFHHRCVLAQHLCSAGRLCSRTGLEHPDRSCGRGCVLHRYLPSPAKDDPKSRG
jgi:hypothetical protein